MAKKQEKCLTEACDEMAAPGKAGWCPACYSGMYRMTRNGPAWVAKRVKAVNRLASRFSLFTPKSRR